MCGGSTAWSGSRGAVGNPAGLRAHGDPQERRQEGAQGEVPPAPTKYFEIGSGDDEINRPIRHCGRHLQAHTLEQYDDFIEFKVAGCGSFQVKVSPFCPSSAEDAANRGFGSARGERL